MKRVKAPEEPKSWNYPRLYFQSTSIAKADRIRIIYPNGQSEWLSDGDANEKCTPCWAGYTSCKDGVYVWVCESPGIALEQMRRYDRLQKWPPSVFLGEIK